ncbi:MAG: caspase family protein [Rhodobacteraceae bacterium]|nr:caspase family protein [Paracoccaceae bacterium]
MQRLIVLFAVLLGIVWSGPVAAKRVALVVGNSAYVHAPVLANPRNDAADVASALRRLGFTVIEGLDLDKAAFDRKLRDFAAALQGSAAGVFFYAGHGLQVAGQNYLVPTDAQLGTASSIEFEMVRADFVQRVMEREAGTNVLFLDACRDNPLARNLARAMGTRSADVGRGLAAVESGVGTLISFSTQPGNVALDGSGRNSPFAGALVRHMAASKDDLGAILIGVRNDVMKETAGKQVPWEHSALTGRFFFAASPAGATAGSSPPSAASALPAASTPAAAGGRAPVHECDRMAADPYDKEAERPGIRTDMIHAPRAIQACEAAVKAHPEEQRFLFQLARSQDAGGQLDKARQHYEDLAARGYGAAMNALARWYNDGRGVKMDRQEGVYWLRKGVEADNPDSMFWLGHAYQSDGHFGIWPADHAEAARLYRRAADAGHRAALVRLGLLQDHGRGGLKADAAAASRLLIEALEAGEQEAYTQILTFGASWFTPDFRRELQRRLTEKGVYDGPADSVMAPPVYRAVEALKQRRK